MQIPIYYIDAFTDKLFSGNPAAVVFSDINDTQLMQNIAAENNLSETAFIREEDGKYLIRWFAPSCEIDLCGHATIASERNRSSYFIWPVYQQAGFQGRYRRSQAQWNQGSTERRREGFFISLIGS